MDNADSLGESPSAGDVGPVKDKGKGKEEIRYYIDPLFDVSQTLDCMLASAVDIRTLASRSDHILVIRQKPLTGKVFNGKEKDRKPIDPPPIIQLRINEAVDPHQNYLQSPYFFCSCNLLGNGEKQTDQEDQEIKAALAGTLVSSLHRLKDGDNSDGAFFVFPDLSVKLTGSFSLQFNLYEVHDKEVEFITSTVSGSFQVYPAKSWPGMGESTFLTRSFGDQGVRVRLRKEQRHRAKRLDATAATYHQQQHYSGGSPSETRQQSQAGSQQSSSGSLPMQQGYSLASQINLSNSQPRDHTSSGLNLQPSNSKSPELSRKRGPSETMSQPGSSSSHDAQGRESMASEDFLSKRKRGREPMTGHQLRQEPPNSYQGIFPGSRQYAEPPPAGGYGDPPQSIQQSPQISYGAMNFTAVLGGPSQSPQQILQSPSTQYDGIFSSTLLSGSSQTPQHLQQSPSHQYVYPPMTMAENAHLASSTSSDRRDSQRSSFLPISTSPSARFPPIFENPLETSHFGSQLGMRLSSMQPVQTSPATSAAQSSFGFYPPSQQHLSFLPQSHQQQHNAQTYQHEPQTVAGVNNSSFSMSGHDDPNAHSRYTFGSMRNLLPPRPGEMAPPLYTGRNQSMGSTAGHVYTMPPLDPNFLSNVSTTRSS